MEGTDDLMTQAGEYYGDNERMADFMRDHFIKNPEKLDEAVDETIGKMQLSRPERRTLRKRFLAMPRKALIDKLIATDPNLGDFAKGYF
jgi:hypothetical protein